MICIFCFFVLFSEQSLFFCFRFFSSFFLNFFTITICANCDHRENNAKMNIFPTSSSSSSSLSYGRLTSPLQTLPDLGVLLVKPFSPLGERVLEAVTGVVTSQHVDGSVEGRE